MKRKSIYLVLVLLVLALLAAGIWIWQRNGAYGFNVLLRRGGTYWIKMGADDARLPPSMREAMRDGREVDRILLNRIDPKRFRFIVRSAPEGDKGLDEWERALPSAVLIVKAATLT